MATYCLPTSSTRNFFWNFNSLCLVRYINSAFSMVGCVSVEHSLLQFRYSFNLFRRLSKNPFVHDKGVIFYNKWITFEIYLNSNIMNKNLGKEKVSVVNLFICYFGVVLILFLLVSNVWREWRLNFSLKISLTDLRSWLAHEMTFLYILDPAVASECSVSLFLMLSCRGIIYYLFPQMHLYIYIYKLQYYIILQTMLHVSVPPHHLQGTLISCLLKL